MKKKNKNNQNIRGLASASAETKARVAHLGGKAKHGERGLQAANTETRTRVARLGGKASRKNSKS